jgi:hypothetical protein
MKLGAPLAHFRFDAGLPPTGRRRHPGRGIRHGRSVKPCRLDPVVGLRVRARPGGRAPSHDVVTNAT